MKKIAEIAGIVCFVLVAGGCVQVQESVRSGTSSVSVNSPTVIFKESESSSLLKCIGEIEQMSKADFKQYFKEGLKRVNSGDDADTLRFICLCLHPSADYKQFQRGKKMLEQYIKSHPESSGELQGTLMLWNRLDANQISCWDDLKKLRQKLLADKDSLLLKVETLVAEVESQRQEAKQNQTRVKELQSQIDQLKNIENIIKNRER